MTLGKAYEYRIHDLVRACVHGAGVYFVRGHSFVFPRKRSFVWAFFYRRLRMVERLVGPLPR